MEIKGFTLVELLGVIIILAVIALITVPIVINVLDDSKTKASKLQKKTIEEAAKKYVNTNDIDYSADNDTTYYITLEKLKEDHFLDSKATLDPKTKEEFNGCVKVEYSLADEDNPEIGGKYTYAYIETNECENSE